MPDKKNQPEIQPSVTEILIDLLLDNYAPKGESANLELKTTTDIMEEFATIADVEKWEIATAMQLGGFCLDYNDAGVFWKMYKK